MDNFVELHSIDNKPVLVNLSKAENIQDHFIVFYNYALNIKEDYYEIKQLLENNYKIENKSIII